ncbi:MAG: alpha/beta fold hydrolase [Mesorhizobium sp.]|nr:MAG: alpha/beta fold hydrolase [Mesorhizobium sp.]TIO37254.1 MAG: alpha/beta fold hydrolase [Mesorhizobium sp.]
MSTLKPVLPIVLLTLLSISVAQAADAIGFRETELPDAVGERPLHVSLWYPTSDDGPVAAAGENRVFYGVQAIRNAHPSRDLHPLVVLSHGYGGSWRNLSWLAGELVHQGYVVAAPDHPGTTTFDRRPSEAARLWERPHDLSRVIDELIGDTSLAGPIEPGRIAAIGHSLGGWTVAALAGARFSTDLFARDCKTHSSPRACALSAELGIVPGAVAELDGDLTDVRIGAVVSLDLGLARGFTPESLAALHVPALVIGAGVDIGDMPAKLESGYLAAKLPSATSSYIEIPDAMHFSFMQLCKPGAVALIEEDTPGDGIVCKDGGARGREAVHREVADRIIAFLERAIPPR